MGELELTEPQFFFSGKPLVVAKGDIIVTPHLPEEETPHENKEFPKSIECSCTIEKEHLSPLIRELLEEPTTYQVIAKPAAYVPKRLPRKLKKAAKGLWFIYEGEIHVKRWELAYGYKRNTKWKRRAYNWMKRNSEPIYPIVINNIA